MAPRSPRKVTYFEPVAPRLAPNTVIHLSACGPDGRRADRGRRGLNRTSPARGKPRRRDAGVLKPGDRNWGDIDLLAGRNSIARERPG
jgi:hypothetical protein